MIDGNVSFIRDKDNDITESRGPQTRVARFS